MSDFKPIATNSLLAKSGRSLSGVSIETSLSKSVERKLSSRAVYASDETASVSAFRTIGYDSDDRVLVDICHASCLLSPVIWRVLDNAVSRSTGTG